MKTIYPNPRFLKDVPAKTRKIWADALVKTKRGQAHGAMVEQGRYCCLMVGHGAFKGTHRQRDDIYPEENSPFANAFGSNDPDIGVLENGQPIAASNLNDEEGLTFKQIAQLIYKPKPVVVED